MLTPPRTLGFPCSRLSLHCSRVCAAETWPAHSRSFLQDCRVRLHRGSSELVTPDCRHRSTTSPSDLPRHKRSSASARIEVYSHLATSKLSTSSPQCRWTSPVAFSSTASSVHHARPSCTPTRSRPELAQREHHHA
jgi:hypothetical protein